MDSAPALPLLRFATFWSTCGSTRMENGRLDPATSRSVKASHACRAWLPPAAAPAAAAALSRATRAAARLAEFAVRLTWPLKGARLDACAGRGWVCAIGATVAESPRSTVSIAAWPAVSLLYSVSPACAHILHLPGTFLLDSYACLGQSSVAVCCMHGTMRGSSYSLCQRNFIYQLVVTPASSSSANSLFKLLHAVEALVHYLPEVLHCLLQLLHALLNLNHLCRPAEPTRVSWAFTTLTAQCSMWYCHSRHCPSTMVQQASAAGFFMRPVA